MSSQTSPMTFAEDIPYSVRLGSAVRRPRLSAGFFRPLSWPRIRGLLTTDPRELNYPNRTGLDSHIQIFAPCNSVSM